MIEDWSDSNKPIADMEVSNDSTGVQKNLAPMNKIMMLRMMRPTLKKEAINIILLRRMKSPIKPRIWEIMLQLMQFQE